MSNVYGSRSRENFALYLVAGVPLTLFVMCLLLRRQRKEAQRRFFAWVYAKYYADHNAAILAPLKRELFADMNQIVSADPVLRARGAIRIVEIGVGTGTNLAYYPPGSKVISVEPNPYFENIFRENRCAFPNVEIERFVLGKAEDMSSIPSDSVDCVVSTLVLCSVEHMGFAIREVKRILVRGGSFYYVEHIGYKEGSWSYRLQQLVQPLWSLLSDGCQLTRDVPSYVEFIGFREMFEKVHYPPEMPFVVRPTLVGKAIK
ncbi:thiol S-methyltransferase TMT1A-like [Amblyomma americanum]|uniref:Methyltransferase type 11 domain-containing protein n=1 Tax=Amblyomma americanum TaxID=6943 RepID=A0AAQ4D763_AMBAM